MPKLVHAKCLEVEKRASFHRRGTRTEKAVWVPRMWPNLEGFIAAIRWLDIEKGFFEVF